MIMLRPKDVAVFLPSNLDNILITMGLGVERHGVESSVERNPAVVAAEAVKLARSAVKLRKVIK